MVGQLGQWQEYRHTLTTRARSLANHLRALDTLVWPWLGLNQETGTGPDATPPPDSDLLNFYSPSLHQPYAPTTYHQSIQDELYRHAVSIVLNARTFLEKVLARCWDGIRRASVFVDILFAAISSPILFCSVSWEKRRWFLVHGARPPKVAQAIWARLPEACSGSALA
jgi:hypothetical protein